MQMLPLITIMLFWGQILNARDSLHVLFSGKIHGYIRSENSVRHGDLLTLKHLIQDFRSKHSLTPKDMLIFDTGDAFSYHYLSKLDSGRTLLHTMEQSGYNGMVVGNLDFKYGAFHLQKLNHRIEHFTMLASNIVNSEKRPFLTPYQRYHKSGFTIGVIGVVTPDIQQQISPPHFTSLRVLPPETVLPPLIQTLKKQCDLVILLSHMPLADNLRLARSLTGIDIIIGQPAAGDSIGLIQHFNQKNQLKTIVVNPPSHARGLGHLRITRSQPASGTPFSFRYTRIAPPVSPFSLTALDSTRYYQLLEQPYRDYCQQKYQLLPDDSLVRIQGDVRRTFIDYTLYCMLKSTRSEIAIINEGFFRFPPDAGSELHLTPRRIEQINWADDQIVTMRLTGKALKALLKRSHSQFQPEDNPYLHFLAIQNHSHEKHHDSQQIHGRTIVDEEIYAVVTNQFLAEGGDGYQKLIQHHQAFRRDRFKFKGATRITAAQHGKPVYLNELLVKFYSSAKQPDFERFQEWLSHTDLMKYPLWRININHIGLGINNVSVANNETFTRVTESRVNAATQNFTALGIASDIQLLRQTRAFQWENRFLFKHDRLKSTGKPVEELNDHVELQSLLDIYKLTGHLHLPTNMNIFSGGRLETELTSSPTESGPPNPRKQIFYASAGIHYTGKHLKEARFGYVAQYNRNTERINSGLELNTRYEKSFTFFTYQSGLRIRFLFSNAAPTPGEESGSIDFSNYAMIKLSANLYLKPQVDIFWFRERQLRQNAANITSSLQLSYSKFWKPQYLKFFRRSSEP